MTQEGGIPLGFPIPNIGRPNDWQFIDNDWRLTEEGLSNIPPTPHEIPPEEYTFKKLVFGF